MAETLSTEIASQSTSPLNDKVAAIIDQLETKLNDFSAIVEMELLEKIGGEKYSIIIVTNLELAERLQETMDDEIKLRVLLCETKNLAQDIGKLDEEIKKFGVDVFEMANKKVEERQKLIEAFTSK